MQDFENTEEHQAKVPHVELEGSEVQEQTVGQIDAQSNDLTAEQLAESNGTSTIDASGNSMTAVNNSGQSPPDTMIIGNEPATRLEAHVPTDHDLISTTLALLDKEEYEAEVPLPTDLPRDESTLQDPEPPSLDWIDQIIDPDLQYDTLKSGFLHFVFYRPPTQASSSSEAESAAEPSGRTRKIRRDQRLLRAEAARELEDLMAPTGGRVSGDHEDMFIDDLGLTDMHGADRDATLASPGEQLVRSFFQPLLLPHDPELSKGKVAARAQLQSELEIQRRGEEALLVPIPERIQILLPDLIPDVQHGDDGADMFASALQNREIPWIVAQLSELTFLRHHRDVSLFDEEAPEGSSLSEALTFVLHHVRVEHLEPAFLMLYRQQALSPLVRLAHGYPLKSDTRLIAFQGLEQRWTHPDYAVCSHCGTRQPPGVVAETKNRNHINSPDTPTSYFVSYATNCVQCREDTVERRPCSVQLGRVLWDIVELSAQFHRATRRMNRLLQTHTEDFPLQETGVYLACSLCHPYEIEFLDSYAQFREEYLRAMSSSAASAPVEWVTMKKFPEMQHITEGKLWEAYHEWAVEGFAYARNLVVHTNMHKCPRHNILPLEWASQFTCAMLPEPQDVLSALQRYSVTDVAVQPIVLSLVARQLCEGGIVEVKGSKGVARKLFSRLCKESEGLLSLLHDPSIHFRFTLSENTWNDLLRLDSFFVAPYDDEISRAWNELRTAIQPALIREIQRHLNTTMRSHLLEIAQWHVMDSVLSRMEAILWERGYHKVTLPPTEKVEVPHLEDTWEYNWESMESLPSSEFNEAFDNPSDYSPRILGVYVPTAHEPVIFAQLSESGLLIRTWRWPSLRGDNPYSIRVKEQQLEELSRYMEEYPPHAIAVGLTPGAHNSSRTTQSVFATLQEFFQSQSTEVIWTPTDLATCYTNSIAADKEFPSLSRQERMAIALARRLRSPMYEMARLCNTQNDILDLTLHEDQHLLPRIDLRRRVDEMLSLWVSATGVSIGELLATGEPESVLQFVSGLGPWKTREFCAALRENPEIATKRRHLQRQFEGETTVGRNAIACIRTYPGGAKIKRRDEEQEEQTDDDAAIDPLHALLDSTRIHPEHYPQVAEILRRIAHPDVTTTDAAVEGISTRFSTTTMTTAPWDLQKALPYIATLAPSQLRSRLRELSPTLSLSTFTAMAPPSPLHGRDLEFVLDELTHLTRRSVHLRSFRKVTQIRFFESMCRVTFQPQDGAVGTNTSNRSNSNNGNDENPNTLSLRATVQGTPSPPPGTVLRQGERVACQVLHISADLIVTQTNRLLPGLIARRHLCAARSFADSPEEDNVAAQALWLEGLAREEPLLRVGDTLEGELLQVNYRRLALTLAWDVRCCENKEALRGATFRAPREEGAENRMRLGPSGGLRGNRDLRRPVRSSRDHSWVPTTIRRNAEARKRAARMFAYKATTHPLFRPHCRSGAEAEAMLQKASGNSSAAAVGQLLVRYSEKNLFVLSFQLSPAHVVHARVSEERTPHGVGYGLVEPDGTRHSFEDVDHVNMEYVSTLCLRFRELQRHPALCCVTRRQEVEKALVAEVREKASVPWRLYCSAGSPLRLAFVALDPGSRRRHFVWYPFCVLKQGWYLLEGGKGTRHATLYHLVARCKLLLRRRVEGRDGGERR